MKKLLIGVLVITLLFAGYLGLAFILHRVDRVSSSNQNSSVPTTDTASGSIDQNLAGTWETACLVPKTNEQWAEKHQFVFDGDKATHTRWSDDSGANNCRVPNMTLVDKYTYTVPTSGQINLNDSQKGYIIYDIYKVEGSTLEFGHGVRLNYAGANKINGETEVNRIDTLNTYLIYKKK